jgi:integrase
MGLRLAETLNLQLADIDSANHRVHIRRGKGHKDRFVPVTDFVLQQMRLLWLQHQHPKYLFPCTKKHPCHSVRTKTNQPWHRTTGIQKDSPAVRY